jgi:hypothetical protein
VLRAGDSVNCPVILSTLKKDERYFAIFKDEAAETYLLAS